jgi:hypothetical protein
MDGMTKDQADKIIDLLQDILSELKDGTRHLGSADSYLFDLKLDVGNIKDNVDSIERKD